MNLRAKPLLSWHQRIVDAIADQDAATAAAAMIEVIQNGLRRHAGAGPTSSGALAAASTAVRLGEEL